MPTKITVIGDTHAQSMKELPKGMMEALRNADYIIHAGDYTSLEVVNGLKELKGSRFIGVYGNADPLTIRSMLSFKEIIEIDGKRFGITHPASGGSHKYTKSRIIMEFKDTKVDAIIYGHTHDPEISKEGGILFINPGKGYIEENYFGSPTSLVILTIEKEIDGEIYIIKK